jgi:hypothetical protein
MVVLDNMEGVSFIYENLKVALIISTDFIKTLDFGTHSELNEFQSSLVEYIEAESGLFADFDKWAFNLVMSLIQFPRSRETIGN